jgi:hypothetical protein
MVSKIKNCFKLVLRMIRPKCRRNKRLTICILLNLAIFIYIFLKDSRRHRRLIIETEEIFIPSVNKTLIKPKNFVCPANQIHNKDTIEEKHYVFNSNQRHILIVISRDYRQHKFISNLEKIFHYSRIKFKTVYRFSLNNKDLPSIVVFESYDDYLFYRNFRKFNFYFQTNKIGIIVFNKNKIKSNQEIEFISCKLNNDSFLNNFLYMTKFNTQSFEINKIVKHNQEFKTIFYDQKLSNSILECETNNGIAEVLFFNLVDEIKHVFVGMESIDEIWLLKSLFIDSLRYLTNGDIDIGLTRHVQIDIDDIFVTKMLPEDVHDLIRLQSDLSLKYFYRNNFKFKFVIGYCGRHYQRFKDLHNPSENENKADELFLGT